jgi:hypothetical protein
VRKRSKAEAQVKTKRKGAMAMAKTAAVNARRDADKNKAKRGRDKGPMTNYHSLRKKRVMRRRVRRRSGEEADDASTSSETEMKKLEAEAELKDGNAELHALERDKQALRVRIQAAKQTYVTKHSELKQTLDAYPAIVSTLFCTIRFCTC